LLPPQVLRQRWRYGGRQESERMRRAVFVGENVRPKFSRRREGRRRPLRTSWRDCRDNAVRKTDYYRRRREQDGAGNRAWMMPRRSIDRLLNASSGISVQPPPPPSAGRVRHCRRAAGSNLPARPCPRRPKHASADKRRHVNTERLALSLEPAL